MRADLRNIDFVAVELAELRRLVNGLPNDWRSQFTPVYRGLAEWAQRQNRLVAVAQDAVSQLQLDITCLRFDLDATRRERDAFRRTRQCE